MSTSDTSIRNSLRASTLLNRPKTAPMGPRTRRSRTNLVVESLLDSSKSLSSTLDLQEFGGLSPSRPISFTPSSFSLISPPSSPSTSFVSDRMSFPVPEEPVSPLVFVHPSEEEEIHSLHTSNSEDSSTKVSSENATASARPKLVPPPGMKFESTSVPWKALPLEAALWMLDSNELQNIVARAIQSSDSFVRLLTLENVDDVLPAELKRLDTLKSVTQSKYRFLVHRRTMLFQALNSCLAGAKLKNGDTLVISGLASQLADTIAECEKLSEELLSISDQMAQINKLIDIHLGSAFAVALRKLNGSLSRRATELAEAKERITQLEIDVQEAWKEAEKVAKELDDYETELATDDTEAAVIEVAEIVSIRPSSPSFSRPPSTPTLLSISSPINPPTNPMASQFGPLSPVKEKGDEAEDVPDTVSIRSSHSTRSAKSVRQRGGETSRTSSVLAAKRRSHRASQSSLRLTGGHSRKQSIARSQSQDEHPPVPDLPLQFTDNAIPTLSPRPSSTLLAYDARSPPPLHRKGSLDTVCTLRSPASSAAALAFRGRSADDMYLRPYNTSASEIQLVQRSQVYSYTSPPEIEEKSVFETDSICDIPSNVLTTSKNIPNMWKNVDALNVTVPHSSPSRTPEPISNSMKTTYSKLKTLTKRYSATLPIFNHKSSRVTTRPRPKSD